MKKSILLGLGAVAMAMGVGAGLAANGFETPVEAAAETTILPESGKIYFNVSAFDPTYNEGANYTEFSISAGGANWAGQHWLTVTVEDAAYGLISAPVTNSDTQFIVVRAASGVKNTWKSGGAWDESGTFVRSTTQNYGWLYNDNGYCNACSWSTVSGASLKVNGVATQTFKYDFRGNEQYVLTEVALHEGDKAFITYGGADYGYSSLQHNAQGDCRGWFGEGASNEIEILADGNYEFYWKQGSSLIWAQVSSDIEAAAWARTFLDATVCTNSGLVDPTFTGKNSKGQDWTWALLGQAFEALTDGAKDTLNNKGAGLPSGTNKSTIENAVSRYDWIIRNHSATFSKFIHDHNGVYRAGVVSSGSIGLGASQKNTAIIVSLLALTGIAGAGALILVAKKRKEN